MAETAPDRSTRRAAVVCRHPASLRPIIQALGVAGLTVRKTVGPAFLPRSQPGEFEAVLLDLDLEPQTPALELVESVSALCPGTPLVVLAGLDTKRRLVEALAHPSVTYLCPKLGCWTEERAAAAPAPSVPPMAPMASDGPDEPELAVGLRRLTAHSAIPLGPLPYLLATTAIEEHVLGSSGEKEELLSGVLALAERLGLSDEKLRRIEVATDELLLNALYDAPRNADGTAPFVADRRATVTLPAQSQVRVRYGTDGRSFVVSVADRFGSLTRSALATHIARVLEPSGPRPRSGPGGAGLGLVLTFSAANQLVVHVSAGRFTEVTAVMHIAGSNRTALSRGSALQLLLIP
jgi:hypothetical protein